MNDSINREAAPAASPTFAVLSARIAQRERTLQTLRIEAAYPDLAESDRELLEQTTGVLMRLNRRDSKRLSEIAP